MPRVGLPLLLLLVALLPWPSRAIAAVPAQPEIRIDLITVGPGDALLTRAGHVALMVTERFPDGRERSRGYNYGDADFGDPWIPLRFVFGQLRFFLSETGDLYDTVEWYGLLQDRDVYRQALALTPAQARAVAERLAWQVQPDNREYDYHYLEHTCSTEARDLIDEVTGGAIQRQLGAEIDPWTVRDFQQLTFDGAPVTGLVGDLLFGRMHDEPITRWYALMWPERMRSGLPEVMVPDPSGGEGMVPLAGPQQQLAARGGAPVGVRRNPVTWILAPIVLAWALLGAAWVRRRGRAHPRLAATWLASWALPSGLLGLAVVVLQIGATLPQVKGNELGLCLLVTDLALVGMAVRWWRRGMSVPRWLWRYAVVRLAVVGTVVGLRAIGVLFQQPWIVPVASLGCSVGLWWVVRSLRAHDTAAARG